MSRGKKDEEEDEPASPGARLMQMPGFDLCILAVMGYKTAINIDLFKNEIGRTLAKHPRFSSLLVVNNEKRGTFSWKRTKVDLEKHIIVPDLDPDMDNPNEFVDDYISGMSKNRLSHEKPLWEVHVLNVKISDVNSTIVFKIDHSIGDGVSLISLVLSCAEKKSSNLETLPISAAKKPITNVETGLMKKLFLSVWTLLLIIFNTFVNTLLFLSTIFFLKDTETLIKAGPGVELSHKRFVHRIISLDDVKFVKNAMNVSINDVVLGVTEAGVSRYLNTIYETQNEISAETSNTLPKNPRIRLACVFNLRPPVKPEDLAAMMEKEMVIKGMWGNILGMIVLPIRIGLEDDPMTYVRRAKANMDRKKHSLTHRFGFVVMEMLTFLFGSKIAASTATRVLRNTTLSFSNVVGPKDEINVFGHPWHILLLLCLVILRAMYLYLKGLFVHYQSYADKLAIVIGADEKLIPNPGRLCDDLVNSFRDIKESVMKSRFLNCS